MTAEREQKKGGSRLAGASEPKPPKKPRRKLTPKQKAIRAVYITVTVLAALVVIGFAVSKLLFVKPDISQNGGRPQVSTQDGEAGRRTSSPSWSLVGIRGAAATPTPSWWPPTTCPTRSSMS